MKAEPQVVFESSLINFGTGYFTILNLISYNSDVEVFNLILTKIFYTYTLAIKFNVILLRIYGKIDWRKRF